VIIIDLQFRWSVGVLVHLAHGFRPFLRWIVTEIGLFSPHPLRLER
jgi:hypothetical protein